MSHGTFLFHFFNIFGKFNAFTFLMVQRNLIETNLVFTLDEFFLIVHLDFDGFRLNKE